MSEEKDFQLLEKEIKYRFTDTRLLTVALTHSSYCNEHRKSGILVSNERSEFLGDSILSVITAEFLFHRFPEADEGFLTRTRAALVCEDTLARFANSISLGDYMLFGKGEAVSTGGRHRKSTLADAFEALIAAIYLDGGMEKAKAFVLPFIASSVDSVIKAGTEDYKSRLQRIVQQTPEEVLSYSLVGEDGPPHDRVFSYEVYLNSNLLGKGKGRSKREAEQAAAKEALILLGELDEEPS
ncbi:MAG: ribonuclease III [Clostridia bacterium]|nr:ribonuclease III [Clostridia bacterium]MBR6784333.1 ribonuclease III [Clostridia bacterium]